MNRTDASAVGRVELKDLCLDVADASATAPFWAAVLGLTVDPAGAGGGDQVLRGSSPQHTLWLNEVPEPKTVKHRAHLDVLAADVDSVLALGARHVADTPTWTVLADPEGAELCVFVREPDRLPDYRLHELVVDAADPESITRWWAERFGVTVQRETDFCWLEGGGLPWPMVFQAVPEPKTVKNRLHWDVVGVTAELITAGATLLRARDEEISWDVLADPEGNEFCVFSRS